MTISHSLFLSSLLIGCGPKQPPESNLSTPSPVDSTESTESTESTDTTPVILGALDKELIDETINTASAAITTCYQTDLANNSELAGKVVYKIVISKEGTVSKVSVKESSLQSPTTEECIAVAIQSLKFPEPAGGGIVIVSYPFIFSPG